MNMIFKCLSKLFFSADGPISEFTPCPTCPAVQYLESVDQSGPAWAAGLRPGDFIIEVRTNPIFFEKTSVTEF